MISVNSKCSKTGKLAFYITREAIGQNRKGTSHPAFEIQAVGSRKFQFRQKPVGQMFQK
ncbi:MAG: hypothetical protein ACYDAP_06540 [Thermoplasmataceae archaeon]